VSVAHDAWSESHTGTTGSTSQASYSWTHTPVGTPRGVLVFTTAQGTSGSTDPATAVTYGGVALAKVPGGQAKDTATERGCVTAWFLGSGVPTGPQSVVVTRTNNTTVSYSTCMTVTAAADTEVPTAPVLFQENGTFTVRAVDDGSPGANSQRYAQGYSGGASVLVAGTGSTVLGSIDFGAYTETTVRETTPGQGSRNVGFSYATSDDRAAVHLAVSEVAAADNRSGAAGANTGTASQAGAGRKGALSSHGTSYAAVVLADAPEALWLMDEASGYPQDATGHGHNVTGQGGVPDMGASPLVNDGGHAAHYDRTTDYHTLPHVALADGDLTVEAWVKRDAGYEAATMWYFGEWSGDDTGWTVGLHGDGGVMLYSGGHGSPQTIGNVTGDTNPHHVVVSWDHNPASLAHRCWVDGVEQSWNVPTSVLDNTANAEGIGAAGASVSNSLGGVLDAVAVYRYRLSDAQVAAHYAAGLASGLASGLGDNQAAAPTMSATGVAGAAADARYGALGAITATASQASAGRKASAKALGALAGTATLAEAGRKAGKGSGALSLASSQALAGRKAASGGSTQAVTASLAGGAGRKGGKAALAMALTPNLAMAGGAANVDSRSGSAGVLASSYSMSATGRKGAARSLGALATTSSLAGAGRKGVSHGLGTLSASSALDGAASKGRAAAAGIVALVTGQAGTGRKAVQRPLGAVQGVLGASATASGAHRAALGTVLGTASMSAAGTGGSVDARTVALGDIHLAWAMSAAGRKGSRSALAMALGAAMAGGGRKGGRGQAQASFTTALAAAPGRKASGGGATMALGASQAAQARTSRTGAANQSATATMSVLGLPGRAGPLGDMTLALAMDGYGRPDLALLTGTESATLGGGATAAVAGGATLGGVGAGGQATATITEGWPT